MTTTEYSSSNSGGDWWLTDQNWKDLEAAGWKVDWFKDQKPDGGSYSIFRADENGRWLGALATSASRSGISFRDAIAEWERVTGESPRSVGCNCCGAPHSFTSDEGDYYYPVADYGQPY